MVVLIITICGIFYACKTDQQIDAEAQKRAQENFEKIELSRVDRYPLFENCDEMEASSACFYRELHELITEKLIHHTYDYKWTDQDSLVTAITVEADGQLKYDSIVSAADKIDKKELDSIFRERLHPLCKIDPAIVQGVPVATSYLLPIKFTMATD